MGPSAFNLLAVLSVCFGGGGSTAETERFDGTGAVVGMTRLLLPDNGAAGLMGRDTCGAFSGGLRDPGCAWAPESCSYLGEVPLGSTTKSR